MSNFFLSTFELFLTVALCQPLQTVPGNNLSRFHSRTRTVGEVFHQSRSQPQRFLYLWVVCSCLYVQLFIGCLSYCPLSHIFSKFSCQEVCNTVFSAVFCLVVYFNTVISQGMGTAYGQPIASNSPSFTQHSSPLLYVSSCQCLRTRPWCSHRCPLPHTTPWEGTTANSGIKWYFSHVPPIKKRAPWQHWLKQVLITESRKLVKTGSLP